MKKYYFAIIVLITASISCSLFSAEVPAADDPAQSQGAQTSILFADDFSDSTSGWDVYVTDNKVSDYYDGSYRIFTTETQFDVWANPSLDFSEPVRIEVDATKIGGPDDNDFGIICDYQDIENFHVGLISSDGYAVIAKLQDQAWEYLSSDGMEAVGDINQGSATNHIRFDCNQGNLTLYVNGNQIASAFDNTFIGGDVGLQVGTFDTGGVDILFDNFVVMKP